MTWLYHSWAHSQRAPYSPTEILASPCSLLLCGQQQGNCIRHPLLDGNENIPTKECYSAIKTHRCIKFGGEWLYPEITTNKRTQTPKGK